MAGETVLWLTQDQSKVISSGTLHALDLATGAARWEQPLSGFAVIGGAVVHGETVFVSTRPAAFDLATGEPRWRAQPGGQAFGAPALSAGGETLYVGASSPDGASGTLLAIDTADGRERWRADLRPDLLNLLEPPWPSGQTVVVPMLSGAIIGLDATSGEERWRHAPAAPMRGAITVAEGRVWFLQENARLFALDAQSGAPVAHFGDLDYDLSALGLSLQRPALIGGTVIVPINLGLLGFEAPR